MCCVLPLLVLLLKTLVCITFPVTPAVDKLIWYVGFVENLVTLNCKVLSKDINQNYSFAWHNQTGVFCDNGNCNDKTRYSMTDDMKEYTSSLTFLNFQSSDFNIYSCIFGFYSYRKELTLKYLENTILVPPTNENVNLSMFISNESLHVNGTLTKIFPERKCSLNFTVGSTLTIVKAVDVMLISTEHVIFLTVFIESELQLPSDICEGTIVVNCVFGSENITVAEEYVSNCPKQKKEIPNNKNTHVNNIISDISAIAIIIVLVLTLVFSVVCIYIKCTNPRCSYITVRTDIKAPVSTDIKAPVSTDIKAPVSTDIKAPGSTDTEAPAAGKIKSPQLRLNKKRNRRSRCRRRQTHP